MLGRLNQVMSSINHTDAFSSIAPLQGSSNYHSWCYQIKLHTNHLGIFPYLDDNLAGMIDPASIIADDAKSAELVGALNSYFFSLFKHTVDAALFRLVQTHDARGQWESLKQYFSLITPRVAAARLRDLFATQDSMSTRMELAQLDVFQHYCVTDVGGLFYLSSLSDSIIEKISDHFMKDVTAARDARTTMPVLTPVFIDSKIIQLNLANSASTSNSVIHLRPQSSTVSPSNNVGASPNAGSTAASPFALAATASKPHTPNVTCGFCSKPNHTAEQCFKRIRQQQQKDKAKSKASPAPPGPLALCAIETPSFPQPPYAYYSEELVDSNSGMDYSFFSANLSSEFIVDSGSTRHVCNNQNLFSQLDRSYSSSIKIADGETLAVQGQGDIIFHAGTDNEIKLSNVLFVPNAVANLFSLRQACTNSEYGFIFTQDSVNLIRTDSLPTTQMHQFGEVSPSMNLYTITGSQNHIGLAARPIRPPTPHY
ncbi:hypothetical protein L150_06323 [Candida albicans Ca529L]|nr:hypothetical protein L150_06323 [Candida albicans Ca529L]